MSDAELDRIRAAYRERDAAKTTPYRWDNPGYVIYMQSIERALLRAFSDAGLQISGGRVLDVGCGKGYFLHRIHEYGAGECHGIDLVESRIADARTRYPALNFHVGSATELPFGDGEFDIAMQFTCLSSIVDNKVRKDAAREMQRVARGGWVLSLDLRGPTRFSRRGSGSTLTPTVALDKQELHRLFGEPSLLRGVALAFNLAQLKGQHRVLSGVLSLAPPQRSHLLGLWRVAKGGDRFDRAALAVADGRVRLTKTDSRNETRSGRSPS